jgi:alpha-tubulin suppressor-like RCC1 family protein
MKKILGIAVGIMLLLSAVNVFAVSGAVYVGDDSAEMMFTGSVSSHYLLLSSNGVLSAWGDNTYGQCGAPACDTLTDINYIDFDDKIVKVSAGNEFSLALDENNTVWGWGNNSEGQLGISRTEDSSQQYFDTPQKITDNITDIAAGEGFSVFLTDSGEVLLSGMNKTLDTIDFPERNGEKPKIKLIAAGYDNVAAVDENNVVYYLKADIGKTEITELPENETVQAAAVGMEHLVFKCLNGDNTDIYTYGDNTKYQLGTGSTELTDAPVRTLSLPRSEYENVNVNVYAGKYNTVVNAWNNMSFYDNVTEYTWGTDC